MESLELLEKLEKINDLEKQKMKIITEIYEKSVDEIVQKKLLNLSINFDKQAEFYNQDLRKYNDILNELTKRYKNQIQQVVEQYNGLYLNVQMELVEAECNQKINMTNLKKSIDSRNKKATDINNRRIEACLQKKSDYNEIITDCENQLEKCIKEVTKELDLLFSDKAYQISVKERNNSNSFINRLKNKFLGANKFKMYVIEPQKIEIEMMDNKLPDVKNQIYEKTLKVITKIQQEKNEANEVFEQLLEN